MIVIMMNRITACNSQYIRDSDEYIPLRACNDRYFSLIYQALMVLGLVALPFTEDHENSPDPL